MTEWLKLTKADIEAVQRRMQAAPATPAVLTITAEDVAATAVPPPPAPPNLDQLAQIMFGLVNAARESHLPGWLHTTTLRWHAAAAATARAHAVDMQQRDYVAHTTPEGVTVAGRLSRDNVSYLACGENIGVIYGPHSHSQQGVYDIHRAIMEQPPRLTNHRGNLLNPIWTHVGIGLAYNAAGALFITQNFISAPG